MCDQLAALRVLNVRVRRAAAASGAGAASGPAAAAAAPRSAAARSPTRICRAGCSRISPLSGFVFDVRMAGGVVDTTPFKLKFNVGNRLIRMETEYRNRIKIFFAIG